MEERKTAGIVLLLIALIAIFYFAILPEIHYKSTHTISFNTCIIRYKYFDKGLVEDADRSANNKLALCLCNVYMHKPDTAVANKLFNIYRNYGNHNGADSVSYLHNNNLDSIVKNRKAVFDTLILVD